MTGDDNSAPRDDQGPCQRPEEATSSLQASEFSGDESSSGATSSSGSDDEVDFSSDSEFSSSASNDSDEASCNARTMRWLVLDAEAMQRFQESLEVQGSETVHIQVRLRSGKKKWTVVSGLPQERMGCRVDFTKLLRAVKFCFKTSGTLKQDSSGGFAFQLQGDCWKVLRHFLLREGLADRGCVRCHGALGDGLAGLSSLAQLERSLLEWLGSHATRAPRSAERQTRPQVQPQLPAAAAAAAGGTELESDQGSAFTSWKDIQLKLQQTAKLRGRRSYAPARCLAELESLLTMMATVTQDSQCAFGPSEMLTVLNMLVITEFDASLGTSKSMAPAPWRRLFGWVKRMSHTMQAYPEAVLGDIEGVSNESAVECLASHLLVLEEELHKHSQCLDSENDPAVEQRSNYVECKAELLRLLVACQDFLQFTHPCEWRIAACILDNVYHMDERLLCRLVVDVEETESRESRWPRPPLHWSVPGLVALVRERGDAAAQARAVLQLVYHHACHGRFSEAKTLLLLSNVTEQVSTLHVPLQLIHNCTLAELGLCAFKLGQLGEARSCLEGLCARGRACELLGQGHHRRRHSAGRQPRLSVRLVEVVEYICALLLEAPRLLVPAPVDRAQGFWSGLRVFEKLPYGLPENDKEYVFVAALRLRCFDWEASAALLVDVLQRCAPDFSTNEINTMLVTRVKDAALQVYLVQCSFESWAPELSRLANMFGLEEKKVRSTVNRMIAHRILAACWDESSRIVLFQDTVAQAHFHELALNLADVVHTALASNERYLKKVSTQKAGKLWQKELANLESRRQQASKAAHKEVPKQLAERKGDRPKEVSSSSTKEGVQAPGTCDAHRVADASPRAAKSSSGRQSAFRKKLTNLNKAIVRWNGQVKAGQLLASDVESRIRSSDVVQHLKTLHSENFREEDFIQDLLSRAGA